MLIIMGSPKTDKSEFPYVDAKTEDLVYRRGDCLLRPMDLVTIFGAFLLPNYVYLLVEGATNAWRDATIYFGLIALGVSSCIGLSIAVRIVLSRQSKQPMYTLERCTILLGYMAFAGICVVAAILDVVSLIVFLPAIAAAVHIGFILNFASNSDRYA